MKFDEHKYWKHDDCMDVFILVTGVDLDADKNTILWCTWLTQGLEGYWCADPGDRIVIKPNHYDKWKPYEPKGQCRF